MTKQMIQTDSRLFLFQVIESAKKQGYLKDAFLDKLIREGTQMSFAFAKRYYNVVHEAYLKHSAHCVLGIINIGLIESSDSRMNKAVKLLLQKGLVGMFREGWTRILKLAQYANNADRFHGKTMFELEKDFSEMLSAEPGKEWIGYDEYLTHMILYCSRTRGKNGTF